MNKMKDQTIMVAIATPSRDGYTCRGYTEGLLETMEKKPKNVIIRRMVMTGSSDIVAARAKLVEHYMKLTENTKDTFRHVLLWVDGDTGFRWKHVKSVLDNLDSYPLLCVPQAKKKLQPFDGQFDMFEAARELEMGPEELKSAVCDYTISGVAEDGSCLYTTGSGFGFLAVTREVLGEALEKVHSPWELFLHSWNENEKTYQSEDITFCKMVAVSQGSQSPWIVKMLCTSDGVIHDNCGDEYPSNIQARRKLLEELEKMRSK